MFCCIYNVQLNDRSQKFKNISIIRISLNKFKDASLVILPSNVAEFLRILIESAKKDQECYNAMHPWNDVAITGDSNKEFIIVYNTETNHIQGWCNIQGKTQSILSDTLTVKTSYKVLLINKLVVRERPKINNIGKLILEFIKDNCLKDIYYKDENGDDILINYDVVFLYSLTSAIGFYKKTYFVNNYYDEHMKSDDPKMEENELLKHVFTYVPDITKFSMRDILSILKDLHIEDVNSVLDETELEKIKTFVANTRCLNKNPNIINKYITLTETKPYNPKHLIDTKRKISRMSSSPSKKTKVSPIISPSKRISRITRQ